MPEEIDTNNEDPLQKAITEYEELMGIKLNQGQRMIFTAGYQFALIDNKLMQCQKDAQAAREDCEEGEPKRWTPVRSKQDTSAES